MFGSVRGTFSYITIPANNIAPYGLEHFSCDWREDTILGLRRLDLVDWSFRELTEFIGRKLVGVTKSGTVCTNFYISPHIVVSADLEESEVALDTNGISS